MNGLRVYPTRLSMPLKSITYMKDLKLIKPLKRFAASVADENYLELIASHYDY